MKVALLLGGATADAPGTYDDYKIVNGGAKLSAHGFSVGGHLADVEDEMNKGSGTAYSVGASYGQGPWAVSATFHDGEVSHNARSITKPPSITHDSAEEDNHKVEPVTSRGYADDPGAAEMSVWALGTSYTLGPGVRVLASYQNAEVTVNPTRLASTSNEGSAFTLGLKVNF